MFEAKVIAQSNINDLDGHGHELPTLIAYIRFVAACSDLVVVCQIDIEA